MSTLDLRIHRFSFEGSTTLLADHLVNEHGVTEDVVKPWRGGMTQGDWNGLDYLHTGVHRH